MKKTTTAMIALACIAFQHAQGQSIGPSTLNAAGGSGSIGSNKFDWSIGEMTMVSTFSGSSVIVTQGVLQNNKNGTGIQSHALINDLQVFPNPASDLLNLKFTTETSGTLSYQLMDITGRVIRKHSSDIQRGIVQEQLSISDLAAATYMLEVFFRSANNEEERSSFKIDKLK